MTARGLTLVAQRHALADARSQRARLAELPVAPFPATLHAAAKPAVLQMNVGKRCNQTCAHCHVDAGPDRTEVMPDDVVDACLRVLAQERIATLDITGGAPELHPKFRAIVERASSIDTVKRVIHRCNLTALGPDLARFLASKHVEIVASLPSWQAERTDAQRGDGVFERSIAALRMLNELGYGIDAALPLSLMSNPVGAFLPASEKTLDADFKRALEKVGVNVTRVSVLTNMPIARFLAWLDDTGNTERYLQKLAGAYNASAANAVMCLTTLSVAWDGALYDCDFNQMLELPVVEGAPRTIFAYDANKLAHRRIATAAHCYGCTAGQGSSCGGALT